MTKTLIPTEKSKNNGQHKNATKNFDYTTIADRLRTVSWSNNSDPTGVVKYAGLNMYIHNFGLFVALDLMYIFISSVDS